MGNSLTAKCPYSFKPTDDAWNAAFLFCRSQRAIASFFAFDAG